MSSFSTGDPFDAPFDLAYVQTRIDALADASGQAQWVAIVDQLRKCADPPRGMRVSDEARKLAKAKMSELSDRSRRGRL